MRVALLTLCRDRLPYSRVCFESLREFAGCEYEHFVLDQGSEDGTQEWLLEQDDLDVTGLTENVGICRGLNLLLDEAVNASDFDVLVRWDNDCQLTHENTLLAVCEAALAHDAIIAPRVQGLRNPPQTLSTFKFDDCTVDQVHHLGGIFMAIPAALFSEHGFRYDEAQPLWAGDELICPWWTARGGEVGYLRGVSVNHYLTTDGQAADLDWYFNRRVLEGGPAR